MAFYQRSQLLKIANRDTARATKEMINAAANLLRTRMLSFLLCSPCSFRILAISGVAPDEVLCVMTYWVLDGLPKVRKR